jgi:serine/threonine protein kinase
MNMPDQSRQKPWESDWKIIAAIGRGSQGATFLVESKNQQQPACLKVLNDNGSKERRERFRRECVALETLSHPRIPHFLSSNSNEFQGSERLYLVSEFIEGITLENHNGSGLPDSLTAIQLVIRLLEVLEYVHQKETVHRDIKPDNVILRDGSLDEPVLVDFGLSYNEDYSLLSTATLQQMGNRFLHLPELQTESGDKRNPISDVTQTCGLLLYVLTGFPPTVLLDDQGRPPHQREPIREALNKLPSTLSAKVLGVFDRGFRQPLAERWQTATQLKTRLEAIHSPQSGQEEASIITQFSNTLLKSPEFARRQGAADIFKEFSSVVDITFSTTLAEFDGNPFTCPANQSIDMPKFTFTANRFLSIENFPELHVQISTSVALLGNEAIVQTSVNNDSEKQEIGRVNQTEPRDWNDVKRSLRLEILRIIERHIVPSMNLT